MCIIQTERLQLCHLCLDDAEFVLNLVNDPGWIRFIGDRGIHSMGQAEAYLQDGPMASYAANGFGLYLVRRKADGQRLGMCGLLKRPSLPHVDIGFAFLAEFTGQGYGFEAATAVLHHARHQLNLSPILAIVKPDNLPSIKLLEKLALKFQRRLFLDDSQNELLLYSSESDPGVSRWHEEQNS
ncbi:MAG: GNAT family N-acetyltransferase [Ardenticatenaceae bacterium]|nr:GNAT family N-acetyltransferase [Anaerolineales bacterium]MCB8939560.1 GNAT family N-acetyltransferase [Ardenticatenaceae bacterium]MCB8975017.1 GNAT family N-acetyltransferase [Ardenticatenaceae bacterium]